MTLARDATDRLRLIWVLFALLLGSTACGGEALKPSVDAGDPSRCCPIGPLSCGCSLTGGARVDGMCTSRVCDGTNWAIIVGSDGCPIAVNRGTCFVPLDAGSAGADAAVTDGGTD